MQGTFFCGLTEPAGEGLEVLSHVVVLVLEMELFGVNTISSSAASPSASGLASSLVRSGLWGHCGFEIFKRKGYKMNYAETLFTILDYI